MRHLLKNRLRRRVIVTLKDGASFAGVLYDADREAFVLRNAEALDSDGRRGPVGVDGEVLILRPDVSFVQLP